MKLLLDMNLSPEWVSVLQRHGWQAVHWSTVGDPQASDRTIMDWAATHEYVVFTHDLDFASMLALSRVAGPSVLQCALRMSRRITWNARLSLHSNSMKRICRQALWSWSKCTEIASGFCQSEQYGSNSMA